MTAGAHRTVKDAAQMLWLEWSAAWQSAVEPEDMKQGKLTENSLQRSVLRQIGAYREELQRGAAPGEDCALFSWKRDGLLVATQTIALPVGEAGRLVVYAADNNIAADGGSTVGISVAVTLPQECEEARLKELMRQIDDTCRELRIQLAGGHTHISKDVRVPVISVTAFGYPSEIPMCGEPSKEYDIVMSKYLGIEGTSILAKERRKELLTRFSPAFMEGTAEFAAQLSVRAEAEAALRTGVYRMHDLHTGGVFGGLWELSRKAGTGFSVDLKKIPVLQETVELCEYFGLNPYQMLSGGSLLMLAPDGASLVRELEKAGIPASVIGRTQTGNDKKLMNEDEVRYLDKPGPDELYRVF